MSSETHKASCRRQNQSSNVACLPLLCAMRFIFFLYCCIIVKLKFEKEFRIRKEIACSRRSESGERHEVKMGRDPSLLFHAFFIILLRAPHLEKAAKDEMHESEVV